MRIALRHYFADQLKKLGRMNCYRLGDRLITRALEIRAPGQQPLPAGAIWVGCYAYPFPGDKFLRDWEDASSLSRPALCMA